MTDLERVREALEFDGYDEGVALLDAHLKEDAERDAAALYQGDRIEALEAELTELREAVSAFLATADRDGGFETQTGQYWDFYERLRQLIEEKE